MPATASVKRVRQADASESAASPEAKQPRRAGKKKTASLLSFFGAKETEKAPSGGAGGAGAADGAGGGAAAKVGHGATAAKGAATPAAASDGAANDSGDAPMSADVASTIASIPGAFKMHPSWAEALAPEIRKPYFGALLRKVAAARAAGTVFPPEEDVFNAFHVPLERVRVVILGQDPYHGPGQAHGLSFSVRRGVRPPPSLRNMLQEAAADIGLKKPSHGCLQKWADQGVLLLNSVLTVTQAKANSHKAFGWETFTSAVVKLLAARRHIVFMLWGKPAQTKGSIVSRSRHCVLTSPHPSPLSAFRGFFGSKPYSQCNRYLEEHGLEPIDWRL